jgi:hypothetical protein
MLTFTRDGRVDQSGNAECSPLAVAAIAIERGLAARVTDTDPAICTLSLPVDIRLPGMLGVYRTVQQSLPV